MLDTTVILVPAETFFNPLPRIPPLYHRRLTEKRKGLCHLQPNRASTNDNHMLRLLCEMEEVFVGQIFDLGKPFNIRHPRSSSGGYHRVLELERLPAHFQRIRANTA